MAFMHYASIQKGAVQARPLAEVSLGIKRIGAHVKFLYMCNIVVDRQSIRKDAYGGQERQWAFSSLWF